MKIIVKQEPLSQVYLSTTTDNNATTLTILRTGAQNQVRLLEIMFEFEKTLVMQSRASKFVSYIN